MDGKIKIWDTKKACLDYTLYGHNGSTTTGCFSPQGDYFATGGTDSMVMLWKSNLSETDQQKINLVDIKTKIKQKFNKNEEKDSSSKKINQVDEDKIPL